MAANARQALNEALTKRRLTAIWEYESQPAQPGGVPPQTNCILKLSLEGAPVFTASASNKKAAAEAAAVQACTFLQGSSSASATVVAAEPASAPSRAKPGATLTSTIMDVLRLCHKEPPLHAHYLQSRDAWGCWMPLSLLLHTCTVKAVRKWFAAHQQELMSYECAASLEPTDHSHQVLLLAQQLRREKEQAANDPPAAAPAPADTCTAAPAQADGTISAQPPREPLTLNIDQLSVQLNSCHPPAKFNTRHELLQGGLLPTDAQPQLVKAVLIKATSAHESEPAVVEVPLTTQAHFLGQVVMALSDPAALPAAFRPPSTMEVDDNASAAPAPTAFTQQLSTRLIFWETAGVKWPCFSWCTEQCATSPKVPGKRSPTGAVSIGSACGEDVGSQVVSPLVEAPHMYSLMLSGVLGAALPGPAGQGQQLPREAQLNVLASWLAGHAVYGDVLVTSCRPRNRSDAGSPVIRWADFTLPELLLAMSMLTPELRHAQLRCAYMVSRLPTTFISSNGWQGLTPKALLESYCDRQISWRFKGSGRPNYLRDVWQQDAGDASGGGSNGTAPVVAANGMELDGQMDEEAGEGGSRPVGMVVLQLPCNGLYRGDAATAPGYKVEVEVPSNHASRWEVAEQNAALSMLHQLHAADCADLLSALTGGSSSSAAASTEADAGGEMVSAAIISATGSTQGLPCTNSLAYVLAARQQRQQQGSEQITITSPGDRSLRSFLLGAVAHVTYKLQVGDGATFLGALALTDALDSTARKKLRCDTSAGADTEMGDGVADAADGLPVKHQSWSGAALVADDNGIRGSSGAVQVPDVSKVLECQPGGRFPFQVRCQSVLPAMEEAVLQLGTGGQAECRVLVPLLGPDPFNILPRAPASLLVILNRISQPALSAKGAPLTLFSPALAASRHDMVQQLALDTGSTRMVDLGCGDAALINSILKSGTVTSQLNEFIGIDISARSLYGASNKLSRILTPLHTPDLTVLPRVAPDGQSFEGINPTWHLGHTEQGVNVKLYLASVLHMGLHEPAAWGDLHGVDMATMVEVIEHLQPELLAQVGLCVLGGLQPRVLLISTPNWEYNKVIRESERRLREQMGEDDPQVELWPGPPDRQGNPMRCSDHRFEWTRQEFEDWCRKNAELHSYSVEFSGVGRVLNEEQCDSAEGSVGCATQVAIFRRSAE